ncbi:glycosyltransferase family 2 protein [Halocella sp. SP3-1]|uniref:glycosyltransferase family 2 protein n=1 Tax=Halocella sp. SP3-1 TaxID=2382161 RepID=UPI000F763EBA|nr:glycosyltransferase family 2 protein [Halocella sp. SP3-1]AZO95635.1 glycosyltransferase family 2 protein [Halocella sp. SP3-1]
MNISIIIPAYNEEDIIGKTLDALEKINNITEIIVVDDGSTDNTPLLCNRNRVRLINLVQNQGKGRAVEVGVRESQGDIIVLLDADLGDSAREVEKLAKPILAGEVDLTIALLTIKGGGVGLLRKFADFSLKTITGLAMKAPLSGQRAFKRKILPLITPFYNGYGLEIGMDLLILKNNIQYKEVPCNFKHRVSGKDLSGFIHRGKQFKEVLTVLWSFKNNIV